MFERNGVYYVCRIKRPGGVECRPWMRSSQSVLTNSRHDPAATAMANPNPNPKLNTQVDKHPTGFTSFTSTRCRRERCSRTASWCRIDIDSTRIQNPPRLKASPTRQSHQSPSQVPTCSRHDACDSLSEQHCHNDDRSQQCTRVESLRELAYWCRIDTDGILSNYNTITTSPPRWTPPAHQTVPSQPRQNPASTHPIQSLPTRRRPPTKDLSPSSSSQPNSAMTSTASSSAAVKQFTCADPKTTSKPKSASAGPAKSAPSHPPATNPSGI